MSVQYPGKGGRRCDATMGDRDDADESRDEEQVGTSNDLPGPWVFGLCTSIDNVRLMIVPDRTAATLVPLIEEYVEEGSWIWSDEWGACNRLSERGYTHETVNHSECFVDPVTGANTQKIENRWKECKLWLKGVRKPNHLVQTHLDELSWRMNNVNNQDSLLVAFLKSVAMHYSIPMK